MDEKETVKETTKDAGTVKETVETSNQEVGKELAENSGHAETGSSNAESK